MSDADVRMILKEKNIEITKNKLVLDIENNMDSLKQNIENILNLEMSNIERILRNDYSIMDFKGLASIKKQIMHYFDAKIEQIIIVCREFIAKETLGKKFIDNYTENFKAIENIFDDDFLKLIKQVENKLPSVENKEKIHSYLEEKFVSKILQKVNVQFKERTYIIINNAKETYNKYLLLNKKTN